MVQFSTSFYVSEISCACVGVVALFYRKDPKRSLWLSTYYCPAADLYLLLCCGRNSANKKWVVNQGIGWHLDNTAQNCWCSSANRQRGSAKLRWRVMPQHLWYLQTLLSYFIFKSTWRAIEIGLIHTRMMNSQINIQCKSLGYKHYYESVDQKFNSGWNDTHRTLFQMGWRLHSNSSFSMWPFRSNQWADWVCASFVTVLYHRWHTYRL